MQLPVEPFSKVEVTQEGKACSVLCAATCIRMSPPSLLVCLFSPRRLVVLVVSSLTSETERRATPRTLTTTTRERTDSETTRTHTTHPTTTSDQRRVRPDQSRAFCWCPGWSSQWSRQCASRSPRGVGGCVSSAAWRSWRRRDRRRHTMGQLCSSPPEPPPNPIAIDLSHFTLLKVVGQSTHADSREKEEGSALCDEPTPRRAARARP